MGLEERALSVAPTVHPAQRIVDANIEIEQLEREIEQRKNRLDNTKLELERATKALSDLVGARTNEKLFHLPANGVAVRLRRSSPGAILSVDVLSLEEVKRV